VVGIGFVNTGNSSHVFLYTGGQMTDLGAIGSPSAISDAGEIVGTGTNGEPFVYSNGKVISLGFPAGTIDSSAKAIDSTGKLIAGSLYFSSGPTHAALYNNGTWVDLGVLPGAATSSNTATGVNSSGQVVGTTVYPITGYHPRKGGNHVAFVYQNGGLVNLNTLVPANSGFTITDAIGINDSGHILCNANEIPSGIQQAIMLTPK
jgi:probable HAF family extracellular repeat protein